MSSEIFWLTATALLAAVLWVPYVLNRIAELGLMETLGNGGASAVMQHQWAIRARAAHANLTEGLVIFAPLALAVEVTGMSSELTATLCAVYFFARLAHVVIYTVGIPVARTLAFATGQVSLIILALHLLGIV